MMRETVAELGMANAEMLQILWNTTMQTIPMVLRELTCHFGSTEVDIVVPPFNQCEVMMTDQAWGHLWTRGDNETF